MDYCSNYSVIKCLIQVSDQINGYLMNIKFDVQILYATMKGKHMTCEKMNPLVTKVCHIDPGDMMSEVMFDSV